MEEPFGRPDLAGAVAFPIVAIMVLAVWLLPKAPSLPPGSIPGPNGASPSPMPASGVTLPVDSFALIVAAARAAGAGAAYTCSGPYADSPTTFELACRRTQALVTLEALSDRRVYELTATWFGFDPRVTDLPIWAGAVFGDPDLVAQARAWVVTHAGASTSTTIGGIDVIMDGTRGALSVRLAP